MTLPRGDPGPRPGDRIALRSHQRDPQGQEEHIGHRMFESTGDECGDRKDDRQNLIRHTSRRHTEPDGQADKHIAEYSARQRRNGVERDLCARNPAGWVFSEG